MKFMHISDLHLGKRVNDFSMVEDQKYILKQILSIIDTEHPDGILIAGDVYDKSSPSDEAVKMLDDFIDELATRKQQVYIISGNHDSATKLSFASRLIDKSGIHISPVYDGTISRYEHSDGIIKVNIYMLPFIKPANVRRYYGEKESIRNYTDAVRVALDNSELHACAKLSNEYNILLAHQFVTGAVKSDSEDVSVGGIDNVDADVFDDFDYVALGHIHGPQVVGRANIRYCGTPLKYSLSEINHDKSVTMVEIDAEGVHIRAIDLVPLRDMRRIEGKFEDLVLRKNYENDNRDDYIYAVLLDEDDVIDAMTKLRVIYPNIMKLTYDNLRTRSSGIISDAVDVEKKHPIDLFEELFEKQNNRSMSDVQKKYVHGMIEDIWSDNI